ncbi:MAG: DUF1343 domain-containing protein [Saprospirales bacterium]|nr:MAG: DUF1343 domain-containing protein [Saprospirales bacterium]
MRVLLVVLMFSIGLSSCFGQTDSDTDSDGDLFKVPIAEDVVAGAERLDLLLPLLRSKEVGLVVNHSSLVGDVHLLDTLLALGISVDRIFALEHGFRGDADAGAHIQDSRDLTTGIPIISLYGSEKKPGPRQLDGLEVILFDIQDVGARFYTYISSMHYIMEAAAENGIKVIVTDRPNPNGFYVDGPVLDTEFRSFVGMHPVPVVHGMTVGEFALMIRGENWINQAAALELKVIPCLNYDHSMTYVLPVRPSPNLPNLRSILLYPSLCFFEGTNVSVGRGTELQFQLIGSPFYGRGDTVFTPVSMPGATHPPFINEECNGYSFSSQSIHEIAASRRLDLSHLIKMFEGFEPGNEFFLRNRFFDRLAGSDLLRKQILSGYNEEQIRESWQNDLKEFMNIRSQYLLYDDFQ